MTRSTRLFFVFLSIVLTGCLGREIILPTGQLSPTSANLQRIHVATARAPSENQLAVYSGGRDDQLNFAQLVISVPKAPENREVGQIVYPSKKPNLDKQFAAVAAKTEIGKNRFVTDINAELRSLPHKDRFALVFVHGYNNNFAAGIYRQAQIVQDFDVKGVAVNFSWASAGKTSAYLYDRDSVQSARDGLRQLLEILMNTEARGVAVLGHSMGALLTMEALRDIANRNHGELPAKLSAVVLASPDIDVDVFRSQLSAFKTIPKPFVIFVSSKDKALNFSERIRGGHPRVGDGTGKAEWQQRGIAVIDLSTLNDGDDPRNHSTFASSETVIKLVRNGTLNPRTLSGETSNAQLGNGLGVLSDVAASIVYLPAKITGVR